jgi:hypothetical protein
LGTFSGSSIEGPVFYPIDVCGHPLMYLPGTGTASQETAISGKFVFFYDTGDDCDVQRLSHIDYIHTVFLQYMFLYGFVNGCEMKRFYDTGYHHRLFLQCVVFYVSDDQ